MNTNNIAKIVKFLTNGQTATYTEGGGLQGINMLEYGETYLFISKDTSLPYTNCDDGDIDFRFTTFRFCLLYTSPSPRDGLLSRMPSSA